MFKVGTSASATFKIQESDSTDVGTFNGRGQRSDFYMKENMFIEKRERRIKSSGELREITFKGIQANRNKNYNIGIFKF